MINVPLAAGSDGRGRPGIAVEIMAAGAAEASNRQMVLISAGFDAHRDDLLGGLALRGRGLRMDDDAS